MGGCELPRLWAVDLLPYLCCAYKKVSRLRKANPQVAQSPAIRAIPLSNSCTQERPTDHLSTLTTSIRRQPHITGDNPHSLSACATMSYNVYRVTYIAMPRDHHALFVETNTDQSSTGGKKKSGLLLHVIGNILEGMEFEQKPATPEASLTYASKSFVGWVAAEDLDRLISICTSNPPPQKQFELDTRLFPNEPLRRCQEWTSETVDMLVANGVLQQFAAAATEEESAVDEQP
ncbi:hypothetical protein B0T24DRAFT_627071 [Lasiosphaeria ovina]|uniref:Uncharacterized protein n=1 Tax=Lasiosphaeria ovina TaxID=92902 RepID=A0AAE0K5Y0_9PEZI|nr:hypothetical protein B0T24DRAFT_627071 [Lasiosphaeria ovina]